MKLKNRIKQRRAELGITQEELAKQCGVGVATIRRIESGWRNINVATLYKIEKGLKLPKGVLIMLIEED